MGTRNDSTKHEDLVTDLEALRRAGIVELRRLAPPALGAAAIAAGHDDSVYGIERLLTQACDRLDGERLNRAVTVLFGLAPGTRGNPPTELREDAAEAIGVSVDHFRRQPQKRIIGQLADAILGIVADA